MGKESKIAVPTTSSGKGAQVHRSDGAWAPISNAQVNGAMSTNLGKTQS